MNPLTTVRGFCFWYNRNKQKSHRYITKIADAIFIQNDNIMSVLVDTMFRRKTLPTLGCGCVAIETLDYFSRFGIFFA
jgi:hypothetical protein